MVMERTSCINCGATVTGNYCSQCGQRANVKRITFKEGWLDFWARIYGFDGMFPRTLRDLTLHPGQSALEYIKGNRARYYGPAGYFFLMITLMYLVASLLDINLIDFLKNSGKFGMQTDVKTGTGMDSFMQSLYRTVSDNMKVVSFLIIIFQALCARFIFFRKSGFNFIENMILPLYVQGHVYWLNIVSLLLFATVGSFLPNWLMIMVSIGFTAYSYSDHFTHNKRGLAFVKGLGVFVIAQLLFAILILSAMVILISTNQEIYEMLKPSNNR